MSPAIFPNMRNLQEHKTLKLTRFHAATMNPVVESNEVQISVYSTTSKSKYLHRTVFNVLMFSPPFCLRLLR